MPPHYRPDATAAEIARGRELVYRGVTADPPAGAESEPISKHFVCVDCHNTVREEADLSRTDPAARLAYAVEHDLPFLQGSTFWGIADRTSWYNGDYYLKYGDLVAEARTSLAASTQLCAQECSQGRRLLDWELEAILAYYHSLSVTLGELGFTEADLTSLAAKPDSAFVDAVYARYLPASPATFVDPPADKAAGYAVARAGDAALGRQLYERSCQTCHHVGGESDLVLDDYPSTLRWLERHLADDGPLSLYEIIRRGTYPVPGHRPYMPHYTAEKMSDQQVEDLRAYVVSRGRRGG